MERAEGEGRREGKSSRGSGGVGERTGGYRIETTTKFNSGITSPSFRDRVEGEA